MFTKMMNALCYVLIYPPPLAARIHKWRSTLRHSTFIGCDNQAFDSINNFQPFLSKKRDAGGTSVTLYLVPQKRITSNPPTGVPQLHVDQLVIIAHQHDATRKNSAPWSIPLQSPLATDYIMTSTITRNHLKPRLDGLEII